MLMFSLSLSVSHRFQLMPLLSLMLSGFSTLHNLYGAVWSFSFFPTNFPRNQTPWTRWAFLSQWQCFWFLSIQFSLLPLWVLILSFPSWVVFVFWATEKERSRFALFRRKVFDFEHNVSAYLYIYAYLYVFSMIED